MENNLTTNLTRNVSQDHAKIIYTLTDEAPMLATYSLLPIIQRFAKPLGIEVEKRDISVAGRIRANFSQYLKEEQRIPDELTALGELAKTPNANIIKLPNISASIPQLIEAIAELQSQGYNVPNYNAHPTTQEEKNNYATYGKIIGSAVNPVLREGNSDRRCAEPVKKHAQSIKKRNPAMLAWAKENRSRVATMSNGDFYSSEQSNVVQQADSVKITLKGDDGSVQVLKQNLKLEALEVIDVAVMNAQALESFFEKEIQESFENKLMISLHLKATMMKVSDPIMFGQCVRVYFKDLFDQYGELFDQLKVNVNNGLGDVYEKIKGHAQQAEIETAILNTYNSRPGIAMVDSSKGITNLHVPSDVIIDASMPNVIRDGGQMWNRNNKLEDVKCFIPDRCYSTIYQTIIEDCQANGQFDYTTMGHVSNVGLMAKKAEEYGSHDKTFEIPLNGNVEVEDSKGQVIFTHKVQKKDIWRMCQTKQDSIQDWVKLAVTRARLSKNPAVFWLDPARAHDQQIMNLAQKYLKEDHDLNGLDIQFMTPNEAIKFSCKRARAGLDTISVTGNVLRDYLTDLFPIIELGSSSKMLSIVPLLDGGVLLETGAGGSAPKHVEQFVQENHLRWDSLGEYLAVAIGFQELGYRQKNQNSVMVGDCLMEATQKWLFNDRVPGRSVKQIDNRGSNFYIALYWAQALAARDSKWSELAKGLEANEQQILKDLVDCQGVPLDIGGYYNPDPVKLDKAMRPSKIFNDLMDIY